jgi:hypothetical protein
MFASAPAKTFYQMCILTLLAAMVTLNDLPVELVDHVIDYLPCQDSLLHLRLVSRALCLKTSRNFSKTYFSASHWRLGSSAVRAITHFSKQPEVVANLISITLQAPLRNRPYENIWTAKGIDPERLAKSISRFTQLRVLSLNHFGFMIQDAWSFLRVFFENLMLQKLETLQINSCDIEYRDLIKLLRKHRNTIKTIDFDSLNLVFRSESNKRRPKFHSPWSDVLLAMRQFRNNCSITLDQPNEDSMPAQLHPPWEDWEGDYVYKGLTMEHIPDDNAMEDFDYWEDEDGENEHLYIHVHSNDDWRKGVERMCAFYLARIMHEDWEEEPIWGWEDPGDAFWDEMFKEWSTQKQKTREKLVAKRVSRKKWLAIATGIPPIPEAVSTAGVVIEGMD